jgi:hypothetical protein
MTAVLAVLGVAPAIATDTPATPVPAAQSLAQGVWFIRGGINPNRDAYGTAVVFAAAAGISSWIPAAMTGTPERSWPSRVTQAVIIAIVNSHWHLDHVSGNPALRAVYPGLRVYPNNAIDSALGGFLPASADSALPRRSDGARGHARGHTPGPGDDPAGAARARTSSSATQRICR